MTMWDACRQTWAAIAQRIRQRGPVFLMLLVCAIALTACNPSRFTTAEAVNSRIVFSSLGDPKTFNPALSQEYPNVFLYTFDGLVTLDGETGEIVPALAESWEVSEDGLTYVFTLKKDLRWSDGQPLTADDVDVYVPRGHAQRCHSSTLKRYLPDRDGGGAAYCGEVG